MKVVIFGLGSIGKKHISAIKKIDEHIDVFAYRHSKNADIISGVNNIYSLDEIKIISPQFIIISNPTYAHYETIRTLITFNIPLFIEKPLFSELDSGVLVESLINKNIITYVACNLRFLDALKYAHEYIADKRINEVNIYCGSYLPDWRPDRDYKTTYSAKKNEGGGVHIDLIHELDYAYWLFGKPITVHKVFTNKSTLGISAFDYANYTLEYKNFNISVVLNYYRRDPKRTLEIVMENETITVDILANKVYKNNETLFESTKIIADTYVDQLQFFIDEIITKKQEFNTVKEAYNILEICLQKD